MELITRRNALLKMNPLKEYTVTGNPAVFNTNVEKPLAQLLVPFTPIQSGTGDPSPSNVRPITGWTGVTINRTGKNLLNPAWWNDLSANRSFVKYSDGTLVYQSSHYKASDYVSVMGNTEYTLHAVICGQSAGGIAFYDSSKQYISGTQISNIIKTDHTFTTPSNAAYMRFWDTNEKMPWNEVMLVYGSTAPTSYAPYSGTSYPVTFPAMGKNLFDVSSVISGTLDGYGKYSTNSSRRVSNFITLPAGTYTASRNATTDWWKVWAYDLDGVALKKVFDNNKISSAFTLTSESKIRIAFDYVVTAENEVQIESGSLATAYEPYTNTVYGGSLDVVTGELTVDMQSLVFDDSAWSFIQGFFYRNVIASGINVSGYYITENGVKIYLNGLNGQARIYLVDNAFLTEQSDVATLLNGQKLVYSLATPYEIQLDPITVQTLIGDNTIWSDTNGTNTIKYLKKG